MRKLIPNSTETQFDFSELFFSKTDPQGRIGFGNDVFIRVSGYKKDELLGAPHSLVRHPDMPRAIFKLFWAHLNAGQPVAAYVKNMTATGEYYWVLAVACPVPDGFLSIRLRPSSRLFTAAKALYAALLAVEKTERMEGAYARLEPELRQRGFTDYADFMTQALRAELEARDAMIANGHAAVTANARYRDLARVTTEGSRTFGDLFTQVDALQRTNDDFSQRTLSTLKHFNRLGFLSLNMAIAAEKFGADAASLSVISEKFQKKADVIEERVRSFGAAADLVSTGIRIANFGISSLKLQMGMVDFFIRESVAANAFADVDATRGDFLALAEASARALEGSLTSLLTKIGVAEKEVAAIGDLISGLEMIRLVGWIEASRNEMVKASFTSQIDGLLEFTVDVRAALAQFEIELASLREGAGTIGREAARGKQILTQIFAAAHASDVAA